MMSKLANAVLFPLLLKIPNKTVGLSKNKNNAKFAEVKIISLIQFLYVQYKTVVKTLYKLLP